MHTRREFLRLAAVGGSGFALAGSLNPLQSQRMISAGRRVGIIGLDTPHAVAFTTTLNAADVSADYRGFKVVAAYPPGSRDIERFRSKIPLYTSQVKALGVEIVDSIAELLDKSDVVLLETNDGRMHLEQALPVLKTGKRMFIDKPVAGSLADARAIFDAARQHNTPLFSSSSLRYLEGIAEIAGGKIGRVTGVDAYSPSTIEPSHADLFWYGIHGVETLFSLMGTGCKSVSRTTTENTDLVVGTWADNRVGTFRGLRSGKSDFGATVFGEKGIMTLGQFKGYDPLLLEIVKFFDTGVVPVRAEETLAICAFMEAANASKASGGATIPLNDIFRKV